jgi:cytochrome P450
MIEEHVKPGETQSRGYAQPDPVAHRCRFRHHRQYAGHGHRVLVAAPDQLAELQQDPTLWPAAVEEILRFSTVTHAGRRRAAVDGVEVNGQPINAGEGVVVAQDSANRDGSAFPDPDRFDVHRRVRQHMTFGFGVHTGVGAPLARLELEIALSTLFRRMPGLALTEQFEALDFRYDGQAWGVYALSV